MKRYFLLFCLMGMFISTAIAGPVCSAVATNCGLVAAVQAPAGGTCVAYSYPSSAIAIAYDANGNIVSSDFVDCDFPERPIGPC